MTSKEFYKFTNDMAYHVVNASVLAKDNLIVGRIGLANGTRKDAEEIMKKNNFFAVDVNLDEIDIENVSLILEFHYGIDSWDAYSVGVCDVIDCRDDGGKVVLSCNSNYKLIKEIRPLPPKNGEDKDAALPSKQFKKNIFDMFDEFFDGFKFPSFPKLPDFPKFPDFGSVVENTKSAIEEIKDAGDGKAKFYDFSCKIDPDGKVFVKRSTNDGTVTKEFNLSDLKAAEKGLSSTVEELKKIL